MSARPVKMWAVVTVGRRSEFINTSSIADTKRAAWDSFLADFPFDGQVQLRADLLAGHFRLERVTVQLEAKP